jgi:hypothetical protein
MKLSYESVSIVVIVVIVSVLGKIPDDHNDHD